MESLEFILVANSPGELSSLVKPVLENIKTKTNKSKFIRTTLFLTPCQYSSGQELQFAKSLGFDQIVSAEEYRKWILSIPVKKDFNFKYKGVVLYLGGDLLHAVLIAKKLGFKVYAYLHGQKIAWKNVFNKFFVLDEKMHRNLLKDGLSTDRIKIAGDLMMNSISPLSRENARKNWNLDPEKPIVAFLPGSREWEIEYMLPFYETVGADLKKIILGIQLVLIISPFTPMEQIELKIKEGIFDLMAPLSSVSAADLAVTIPGTNTAQVAYAGVPQLVLFPLNRIKDIPLNGATHYLTQLPFVGMLLKQIIAEMICRNTKFFALPNIKAQKMLVPELKGRITPEQVVEKILELLNNPQYLKQIETELKNIMGESNAAEIIIGDILYENLPASV